MSVSTVFCLLLGLLLVACTLLCDNALGDALTGDSDPVTNIADGLEAPTARFPYICTLRGVTGFFSCTGVLVHERLVLTAGHCVYNPNREHDYRRPNVYCGSEKRDVVSSQYNFTSTARIAPCWDGNFRDGCDLALLVLDRTTDLLIPQLPDANEPVPAAVSLTSLGFGLSSFRPRVPVDNLQMATHFRKCDEETHEGADVAYPPTSICTVNPKKEDLCRGDSGGPLLIPDAPADQIELGDPTLDKIIGLDSWGSTKCDASRPQIFTRVSSFTYWIRSIIAELEDGEPKEEANAGP